MRFPVALLLLGCMLYSCATKQKTTSFPFYKQASAQECGPACLKMILAYYEEDHSISELNRITKMDTLSGTNLYDLSEAAKSFGYKTQGVAISYEVFKENFIAPCIVHWQDNHFVVVYKIKNRKIFVADPAVGLLEYDKATFCNGWLKNSKRFNKQGAVLLIEKPATSQ
jgi:ATP-binding cassette, subfamily B, bacterial